MIPVYAQEYDFSSCRVLAVDDIPLNLLLVKKMLVRFNFQLETATGGQEALDSIARSKPDLILLDLMMPGIDGYEVIRRLKSNPETANIRIIILTALTSGGAVSRRSAGIFGGALDNPAAESAKQCHRAYLKFTADCPDYDIDVRLCAFTAAEMREAEKGFFTDTESNVYGIKQ